MLWTNPLAALGLLALAAPVLVHVLARQRAPRLPFPTLRFVRPFHAAAIRRRALEDAALLAVRMLVIAAATAAAAGPFLVTDARRRAWDARVVRADVTGDVRAGLARAIAWLDAQPPGRREIVVRSTFPIGSITSADLAVIPPHIGLRFERTGVLPRTRTIRGTPVAAGGARVDREVTLDGDRTLTRDLSTGSASTLPVEIAAPPDQRTAADDLLKRIAAERVPVPAEGRVARLVFGGAADPGPVRLPWMADAAAQIVREAEPESDLRFGSDGSRLVVVTPASPADAWSITLVRAVLTALAPPADHPTEEIVAIDDAQLHAWTREPGAAPPPTRETIDRDDRRWLWGVVLILLGIETLMRRPRAAARDRPATETTRVA